MTRQNMFEILKNRFNVVKETNKIIRMLSYDDFFKSHYEYMTAEGIVNKYLLRTWKQRGCYLSCKEIKEDLGINDLITKETSNDMLIITLQYYANILSLVTRNLDYIFKNTNLDPTDLFLISRENFRILLEYLNYEEKYIEEEQTILLVPKNPAATAVAEISSEDTALAILKYNHTSLKGCLEEKRKLLYQISLEYEPILKMPIEGYKDFYEKTNGLLNTLHIRHNNTTKENNKNCIIDISDEELEKWYDELYQLLLFCVLIKDNLDRKKEVDDFLKSIKGAKA